MVVEEGTWYLDNGGTLIASEAVGEDKYKQINFEQPFGSPPVVFTQITTNDEPDSVSTTTHKEVTKDNFQFKLQAEAAEWAPNEEQVHYVAWSKSGPIKHICDGIDNYKTQCEGNLDWDTEYSFEDFVEEEVCAVVVKTGGKSC
jgi:hypothetical protein